MTEHRHSHGAAPAASRHTRRIVAAVLIPAAVATLVAMIVLWPGRVPKQDDSGNGQQALATVVAIAAQACPAGSGQQRCGTAAVQVTKGPGKGGRQTVDLPNGPGSPVLDVGDKVVLSYLPGAVPGGRSYSVTDHQRGAPLTWLLVLLAAVIMAFGRWRGLTSLAGLAVSFGLLLFFVVPAILDGSSPLLVAVVGSSAIMFAALYLTHGVNVHTSVAVAGTLASLVLTGLLGAGFTSALHLTGIGSDDTSSLVAFHSTLDLKGLLLAGIVIGALGVLDDVTVTQAVTVAEMATAGPQSRWSLYRSATRVGRAHVASSVNTIVLAYAGTSLPLLLLIASSSLPVGQLLTSEFITEEILRSAVGTIGLVASVPITTALAVLVADLGPAVPSVPAAHSGPAGHRRR
jgi:uncharacterized membrane protein